MKKFLALILFAIPAQTIFASNAFGQSTEVIIIGTVHYPTMNYNRDTLVTIFEKINPDLILVESDSSYFKNGSELIDDVKFQFLETSAITAYGKIKKVEIRPYDIPGRDTWINNHEMKADKYSLLNDVNLLSEEKQLSQEATELYDRILSAMNIADELAGKGAIGINGEAGSAGIDSIVYYTYDGISRLISIVPELSNYRDYWEEEMEFRDKRNEVMAQNIIGLCEMFSGKRIVVLCGLTHKNILERKLQNRAAKSNIILKEYYQF